MNFINFVISTLESISDKFLRRHQKALAILNNSSVQRWSIAVAMCLLIAVLLAPEIHLFAPKFEQGMIAEKDIKADRDFLVEDIRATEEKKKEAAESVLNVYDYDSRVAAAIRTKLARSFSIAAREFKVDQKDEALLTGGPVSQKHKRNMEANLGVLLTTEEYFVLREKKFSTDTQRDLYRAISYFYENRLITSVPFSKSEKEKGITLKDIETQNEKNIKDVSRIFNIQEVDEYLLRRINSVFAADDYTTRRVLFSVAKKLLEPNLTFNKDATERKKFAAMEEVKPVLFQVQKNEMIVREGEKIGYTALIKLDAFYKKSGENTFSGFAVFLGIFLTSIFLSIILYFWRTRNWTKPSSRSNLDFLVMGMLAIIQILFVKTGIFIAMAINRAFPSIPTDACYFAIPFALGAIIIAVLINRNVALILTVFTAFMISLLFEEKITFPLYSFLGSVAASYRAVRSHQRSAFLRLGVFLGLINMAAIISINFLTGNIFNDLFIRLVMGFVGGLLTGVLVAGLTPVFESLFGYITDIRLLELANLNQPLFQKMIIEAPGTYHHSIVVASLVEAAAEAIGANSLLAKVSAYYHDIGKLTKPQYFIENQPKAENRHDKLSPKMSSLVIISHVKDGCELAAKEKLGRPIIDIIREHHGTSIVSYFYDKAKKNKDRTASNLSETDFRYPGPKPQTKEAGLVMLGDVIEASSRTLSNPTPARIRSLVRERIERIYMDGQLDDCELTLKNLNTIAESFIKILTGIFHHRVDYPESPAKDTNGKKTTDESADKKPSK
ncbi:MAG TPA: HDIG domain-containing protein [Smithellaceae bacterium]|nr:HDIG domain-containing protein [Smithellaceae bacterium]HRS89175.1 HDIG domain-containing protein [Smithellaceae bacterium]HRV26099.1 HDIG domain-containing protein [Smithellaceae bacterium]